MTKLTTYKCDWCGLTIPIDDKFLGVGANANGLYETFPVDKVQMHIHVLCLSKLQSLTRYCGKGYRCDNGPKCTSDHK